MDYFENKNGSPEQKFYIPPSGYAKKLDQQQHRSDRNRPSVDRREAIWATVQLPPV